MKKAIIGLIFLASCAAAQEGGFGIGDIKKWGLATSADFATAAQGDLADTAVQTGSDAELSSAWFASQLYIGTQMNPIGGWGITAPNAFQFVIRNNTRNDFVIEPGGGQIDVPNAIYTGPDSLLNAAAADSRYVQPQVAANYLTLDREIASWEDIGVTFSNAVTLNSPITITNDSSWTGWTTTGALVGDAIKLMLGDYLESPVQTNGVARVDYEYWSHGNGTTHAEAVYTNGASWGLPPYRAADGRWRILADGLLPMVTECLYVSNATITAYEDVAEAAVRKDVSNLGMIDEPVDPTDVANMRYVDKKDSMERTYGAAQLTAYGDDADKTVRGAQLRLGNMWVVSPADTSGQRFIVSGGEITGSGQLVGTTNEFVISKNDYPLLSFTSSASGLYITNHTISATSSNVTVNLGIATNGVTAAPYAEWTENLAVGEWSRVMTYATDTYPTVSADTYTLEFTVPATNGAYFRAMQAIGESVMTFEADKFDMNGRSIFGVDEIIFASGMKIVATNGVFDFVIP